VDGVDPCVEGAGTTVAGEPRPPAVAGELFPCGERSCSALSIARNLSIWDSMMPQSRQKRTNSTWFIAFVELVCSRGDLGSDTLCGCRQGVGSAEPDRCIKAHA
jgi:hypothetical protein